MKEKQIKTRKTYPSEFRTQAIELAKEIGVVKAAEKLGIDKFQTLSAWVRYSKKIEEDSEFREIEQLKAENKRLKKQTEEDKKIIAILKDATAFFCQDHLK